MSSSSSSKQGKVSHRYTVKGAASLSTRLRLVYKVLICCPKWPKKRQLIAATLSVLAKCICICIHVSCASVNRFKHIINMPLAAAYRATRSSPKCSSATCEQCAKIQKYLQVARPVAAVGGVSVISCSDISITRHKSPGQRSNGDPKSKESHPFFFVLLSFVAGLSDRLRDSRPRSRAQCVF